MEIPCSNKIKFITACSFSNDSFEDIMKAQVSVIKASATLNIQAFKIKKSVSISFRMTQVHKMAKDHMMMIKDYDWMMISKKLKDHIQVKLKPKSLSSLLQIHKIQINEIKRLRVLQRLVFRLASIVVLAFLAGLLAVLAYGALLAIRALLATRALLGGMILQNYRVIISNLFHSKSRVSKVKCCEIMC
ncbi:hypothetical protein Tco_0144532 [Tanacetum coccineum]